MALILVCTRMVKKSLLEWLCFLYIPIRGLYYSGLSQKLQGFLSLFLWICRIDLYQNEKAPFSVPFHPLLWKTVRSATEPKCPVFFAPCINGKMVVNFKYWIQNASRMGVGCWKRRGRHICFLCRCAVALRRKRADRNDAVSGVIDSITRRASQEACG